MVDRSIRDGRHSAQSNGTKQVARMFGTPAAETILASGHVRPHPTGRTYGCKRTDPKKTPLAILQAGGRPHMDCHVGLRPPRNDGWWERCRDAPGRMQARTFMPQSATAQRGEELRTTKG